MQFVSLEVLDSPAMERRATVGASFALAGEKVSLTYGQKLKINVSLEYRGQEIKAATLYGAIGIRDTWFNEKVHGEVAVSFPKSDAFTPWSGSVEIPITSDIRPGTDYDIYCKIKEYPDAGMPEVDDVVDITGMPPTYTPVYSYQYPLLKTHTGWRQKCVSEFLIPFPEQIFPTNWVVDKIKDAFESEVEKQGGKMLEVKILEDATPLWGTYYRIEATATVPSTPAAAVALAWTPLIWAGIILAILAIIAFVLVPNITNMVTSVSEFFQKAPVAAVGLTLGIVGVIVVAVLAMAAKKKKVSR